MTDETIKQRVKASEWADELATMICEETDGMDDAMRILFVERLVSCLRDALPETEAPDPELHRDSPMAYDTATEFESTWIPFGRWCSVHIGSVPIDYLVWLDGEKDFRRDLNRYLRSEAGQNRQGEKP